MRNKPLFKSALFFLCLGMSIGVVGTSANKGQLFAKDPAVVHAEDTGLESYTFTVSNFTSLTGEQDSNEDANFKLKYGYNQFGDYYNKIGIADGRVLMSQGTTTNGSSFFFYDLPEGYYFSKYTCVCDGYAPGSSQGGEFKIIGLEGENNTEALRNNPSSNQALYKSFAYNKTDASQKEYIYSKDYEYKLYSEAIVIQYADNSNPGTRFAIKSMSFEVKKIPEVKPARVFFTNSTEYTYELTETQVMYDETTVTYEPETPTPKSSKSTYRIKGWWDTNKKEYFTFGTHVTEDVYLVSEWKYKDHSIDYQTYKYTDLTRVSETYSSYYYNDEVANVVLLEISRPHYFFRGWSISYSNPSPITIEDLPTTGSDIVKLYPIFDCDHTYLNESKIQAKLSFDYHYSEETVDGTTTTAYSDFTNITMQFKYEYTFLKSYKISEHGIFITTDEDSALELMEKTATSLPENGVAYSSTKQETKTTYIVSLENIPLTAYKTTIYACGYIIVEGTYYFTQVGEYSLENMILEYSEMDGIKGTEKETILDALDDACTGAIK